MITIEPERCSGCGACLEICPTGALYLVDGKATVDEALCTTCQECLAACPNGAIALAPETEAAQVPAVQPAPGFWPERDVIPVRTQPMSLRARLLPMAGAALPVAGAALAWAGREILPRLADLALDALDRRIRAPQAVSAGQPRAMGANAVPEGEASVRGARGTKRRRRRRRGRG